MERTYTVVLLHERDGRYSAVVPALDCASWGHSIPEALRMVEEAMRCHLASLEEHGQPAPADRDTFTVEMGDATDPVIYKVTVGATAPLGEDETTPPEALRASIKQAGLTVEEFRRLLK